LSGGRDGHGSLSVRAADGQVVGTRRRSFPMLLESSLSSCLSSSCPWKEISSTFCFAFYNPFPVKSVFFFFAPDGQEGKKGCRVNRSYLFFFKLSFLGGTAAPSYSSAVAFFRLFFFGFGFAVESAFG